MVKHAKDARRKAMVIQKYFLFNRHTIFHIFMHKPGRNSAKKGIYLGQYRIILSTDTASEVR